MVGSALTEQLRNDVSVGDLDRDGLTDLVFGSYLAGGEAYVIFGPQL